MENQNFPQNTAAPAFHQEIQKYAELLEHASALLVQVRDGLRRLSEAPAHCANAALSSPTVIAVAPAPGAVSYTSAEVPGERIVEGVFNGYSMIGDDEKTYQIPPNYASKSKLVEGDRLKLVIQNNGQFVYKQIGPVERERRVGKLERASVDNGFAVATPERTYRVLMASVTYYHGQIGDEVVLLVPRGGNCIWAAVENIMKAPPGLPPALTAHAEPQPPAPTSPTIDPLDDDLSSLMSDLQHHA